LGTLEEGKIISSTAICEDRDCDDKPEESIAVNTVTVESWRRDKVHEMLYDNWLCNSLH